MIDFTASACLFEIRVNDYPVIHMNIEGQLASIIPINFAILESGVQSISVTVLPNVGDFELHKKSEVKFNIKLFDTANDFVFEEQFGEYHSKAVGSRKVHIIKYSNFFTANVPYSLEAWQKGIDLKDVDDCRKKLDSAYEKTENIIKNNDFNAYKKLIDRREKNMAASMYLSKEELENRITELFDDFKSGFKLQPVSKDSVMFLCANNKVAMLKKITGEPALLLENSEVQEELMLDLAFYIPEGKSDFEVI